MYDRLFTTACGMFNSLHLFVIALFFGVLWLMLHISRNMTQARVMKLLRCVAVIITILEIIKIVIRINGEEGPDSWVPLYYCSLFIYAIWLSVSPRETFRTVGFTYITMGGIAASVFFIFYPSTALGMYPLFHMSTLHSLLYHLIMCFCGILILRSGTYVPQKRDMLPYALFVFSACILAAIVNHFLGTNCMFLDHPFGLPFLEQLRNTSKPVYMLIVAYAQSVCLFHVCFGLHSWAIKRFAGDAACAETV